MVNTPVGPQGVRLRRIGGSAMAARPLMLTALTRKGGERSTPTPRPVSEYTLSSHPPLYTDRLRAVRIIRRHVVGAAVHHRSVLPFAQRLPASGAGGHRFGPAATVPAQTVTRRAVGRFPQNPRIEGAFGKIAAINLLVDVPQHVKPVLDGRRLEGGVFHVEP